MPFPPLRFRSLWLLALFAAAFIGTAWAPVSRPQNRKQDITVSAAVSLKDALEATEDIYRSQKPGTSIHLNFGGSGTLQRQIEQGAPVDLFISASPEEMDKLESENLLLSGTRKNLARNGVVLIVPAGETQVHSFQDLERPEVIHIAVGEPHTVPAGMYAEQIFKHLGLYDRLRPKFVLSKDVRQVLTYVASGNAEAGIVYATDARISPKVTVVADAPAGSHRPVIYAVAILKSSRSIAAAREFEVYLLGPQVRSVFTRYGFEIAAP